MFIDEARVQLRAGRGGDGCRSFRREKFLPKGGPSGGDGGDGGPVVLVCDRNVDELSAYHFQPQAEAESGGHGEGSLRHGAKGSACRLRVPEGTLVYSALTRELVAELRQHGREVVLLRGGRGGLGNVHFKTATHRAPRETTPGGRGEEGEFLFVLKTMADVGLVGFPNAGKSSLLSRLTSARSRAAPYPFTTLFPQVGVCQDPSGRRVRIADLPGIIAGAHENRGLGLRFLRHIERCRLLLFLLDMAATDGRDPAGDLFQLRAELGHYDPSLLRKEYLILANKMDRPEAEVFFKKFQKKAGGEVWPVSCHTGAGLEALRQRLLDLGDGPAEVLGDPDAGQAEEICSVIGR